MVFVIISVLLGNLLMICLEQYNVCNVHQKQEHLHEMKPLNFAMLVGKITFGSVSGVLDVSMLVHLILR